MTTHKLPPKVRHFFKLLRAPRRREGFRTAAQWKLITNAFSRWPSFRVAESDKTTWVSCCRCKRVSPRACMRTWCFHCSDGQPWLYGAAMELEHAGSFEPSTEAGSWWQRLTRAEVQRGIADVRALASGARP